MTMTPSFLAPKVQKRRKVGFSSLTILQDGTDCQLMTKRKYNPIKKRTKQIYQPKNIITFENDEITCSDTSIASMYSAFTSRNEGISQLPINNNLSWGEEKQNSDIIIDSIDRSFKSVCFDVVLTGLQSLLLLLSSDDTNTSMTISSRLLFCSEDDVFLNIKCFIYDGLVIKETSMLPASDPEVWFTHEKKQFCMDIISQALRNIKQSFNEEENHLMTNFIKKDGPFLQYILSAHLSSTNVQTQSRQISECLMFLLSHAEN